MFVHPFLTVPSDPSLQPSSTTLKVLSPPALQNAFCFPHSFIAYYCNPCLWKSGGGPLHWVKLNFLTASCGSGSYHHEGGQPTFPWESLLERTASPTEMCLARAPQEITDSGCSSGKGDTTWTLKWNIWPLPFKTTVTPSLCEKTGKESFRSVKRLFPHSCLCVFRAPQPVGLDTWRLAENTMLHAFHFIRNNDLWVSFLYFLFWWHASLCVTLPPVNANFQHINWLNIHIEINPNVFVTGSF